MKKKIVEKCNNEVLAKMYQSCLSSVVNIKYNLDDIEVNGKTYPCNKCNDINIGCSVTNQQVTDLQKQWNIDVVKMVKNAALNEMFTTITRCATADVFALGWKNFVENSGMTVENDEDSVQYAVFNRDLNERTDFLEVYNNTDTNLKGYAYPVKSDDLPTFLPKHFKECISKYKQICGKKPNFIVTNISVASELQSCIDFEIEAIPNSMSIGTALYNPFNIKYNGCKITVIVDPLMAGSDYRICFGRTVDGEDGIYYCLDKDNCSDYYIEEPETDDEIQETLTAHKLMMDNAMSMNYIGDYQHLFYTTSLKVIAE